MFEMMFAGLTGQSDFIQTIIRVLVGLFFVISGYHKLFNQQRHATIVQTMVDDHVVLPWFNCWFVPMVEFSGGFALVIGLVAPVAALGLFCICGVATLVDGLKRINNWHPLDRADYVDDVLYLPEVLFCLLLLQIITGGAGRYSLDRLIYQAMG